MQQPVEDRGGDDPVPEHAAPGGETLVQCDSPPPCCAKDAVSHFVEQSSKVAFMSLRRTLAVALLCAQPFHLAISAEDKSAPTVEWVVPWKQGTVLEYALEDLTINALNRRQRTRATSLATLRITKASKSGFVQAWSWRDTGYVVEEGDKAEEAALAKLAAAMEDVSLEVELDGAGNYTRTLNLAEIAPRMRDAMRPLVLAGAEASLAKIADASKREEARKFAIPKVEAILDRTLAPAVLENLLTRNIQWYNAFVGLDIEPDQDYEAKLELPSPLGGAPIPVTLTFSLSISKVDPDDLAVVFEQRVDRENGGAAVTAMVEALVGTALPKEQMLELSIVDEGMFIVHRPSGVVEMFEASRTVKLGERSKIERHRLRQTNGAHNHVWRDEQADPDEG
jgi:hypothetical protein